MRQRPPPRPRPAPLTRGRGCGVAPARHPVSTGARAEGDARRRHRRSRSRGSFSRQRPQQPANGRRRVGGQRRPVRLVLQHRGERRRDVVAVERAPARSASRTAPTPNAQMSARRSTGLPRACSGAHVGGGAEDHPGLRRAAARASATASRWRSDVRRRTRAPSPGRSRAPSPCRRAAP